MLISETYSQQQMKNEDKYMMIILIVAGIVMFAGQFDKYNNKQVGNNIQLMKRKQSKQAKVQEQSLDELKKQNELLRKLLEDKK